LTSTLANNARRELAFFLFAGFKTSSLHSILANREFLMLCLILVTVGIVTRMELVSLNSTPTATAMPMVAMTTMTTITIIKTNRD